MLQIGHRVTRIDAAPTRSASTIARGRAAERVGYRPGGQLLIDGRRRFVAVDSRFFGPVPFSAIIGRKL
jgi:type IV secretory pathway protease TraF